MQTFIFSYHTQSTEYPEGFTAKLGNSYQYAAEPSSVDQRLFKLSFETMFYYTNPDRSISLTKFPEINMAVLEQFYSYHRMWRNFIYPHPVYGNLVARFNKPLMVPAGVKNGNGSLQGFGLELIEQP